MASMNPFDLLLDDDAEDPSLLIAAQQQKIAAKKAPTTAPKAAQQQQKQPAKLPSKPLPPAQAVKEAKNESAHGGGRGGSRGYRRGRGGGGFNRDSTNNENSYGTSVFPAGQSATEDVDSEKPSERRGGYGGLRGPSRGGRRGGFNNEEAGDGERPPHRIFDRRSGTGRGNAFKREGAGRGNWGTQTDEFVQVTEEVVEEGEKTLDAEKPTVEEDTADGKENPANEPEDKEPENKEMTLEEYEKVLEEKRKALLGIKIEGRKVDTREFESMQQLANKKRTDDVFIKLGSEKDKRKDADKEDRSKKSVSINEFLKPAEGERYYASGGRGRGRGRGGRGYSGGTISNVEAPKIEDPGQFPTLGGK